MKPDQERLSEQARAEKYGFVLEALARLTGSLVVGHLRFGRDGAEALMEIRRDHSSLARQLTEAERENGRLTKELRGACEVIAAASIEQGGRLWISESSLLKVGAKTDLIREEDPREPGLIYRALNTGESQDSPPKDSSEALDTGGSEG